MERLRGGCGLDPGVGAALHTWLHTALAVQVTTPIRAQIMYV